VIDQNTPACTNFTNGPYSNFTVDLTWTATGPLASIRSTAISDCGALHEEQLNRDATNPGTVFGTASVFGDLNLAAAQAGINSSDHRSQNMGVAPKGCILRP
jgi:hypothetical protein